MDKKPLVLWADDEIDILRPHILFLQNHGYEVITVNNGLDAVNKAVELPIDVIILDEHMPGISGLATLSLIKEKIPHIPVIMITKNEEEDIMNFAIGSKISDYLIKPVNPRQILSSLKKFTHRQRLVSETAANRYFADFRQISQAIGECRTFADWVDLYARLTYWQFELSSGDSSDPNLIQTRDMLAAQLLEAEKAFFRFARDNYLSWIDDPAVITSNKILRHSVLPVIDSGQSPWLVLIDNFRLDNWYALRNLMSETFRIEENIACSIIPTTTQYARNSVFSGLLPAEIKEIYPRLWIDENSHDNKNQFEEQLLKGFFNRVRRDVDIFYTRLYDSESCEKLISSFSDISSRRLKVIVISFVDMLSHERTHSKALRELSFTDAGFRAITESWFRHSPVALLFRKIALAGQKIILTTDHGTIRVNHPVTVVADKTATDTLRYKHGRNLRFEGKDVLQVADSISFGLPSPGVASSFIFAGADDFFVYRNNFNQFVKLYGDTYQHGGISLQEMIVPLVALTPK